MQSLSPLASPVRTSNISEREGFSFFFFFSSPALRSYRPNYRGWVRSGGTSRGQNKRSWPCLSLAEPGLQPNAVIPGWVQVLGTYIDKVLGKSPCAHCLLPPPTGVLSREAFQSKMCANCPGSTLKPPFSECATCWITVDGTNGKVWVAMH